MALLFAGCDDDESPAAVELSGVFQAGGISGLRYVTPTRSGLTDTNGPIKYLAGESVAFSVVAWGLVMHRGPLENGVLMLAQSYLEFSFIIGAVAAFCVFPAAREPRRNRCGSRALVYLGYSMITFTRRLSWAL